MYQTSANSTYFILGSAIIEIPSSAGSATYINMGAASGIKITESWELSETETGSMIPNYEPRNHQIIVEADLFEFNLGYLNIIRGGIDIYSSASTTFTSGGLSSMNSLPVRITNTGPTSSQAIIFDIYNAHIAEGMTIPFNADDSIDVSLNKLKMIGTCQSSRTAGAMLYNITDTRTT